MYFPLQYTTKVDSIKIDTLEFQNIYDGLQQFKEPIIWNSDELNNSIRITVFNDTLPEVLVIRTSNSDSKVVRKTAKYGFYFWKIDQGYIEEIKNINHHRLNRVIKCINEIIDEHKRDYKNVVHPKDIVIETKFNNKYEFIITDPLILYVLKQYRKFRRILKLLE